MKQFLAIVALLFAVSSVFAEDSAAPEGNHPGFQKAAAVFGYPKAEDMKDLAYSMTSDWRGKSKQEIEDYITRVLNARGSEFGAMRKPGSMTLNFFAPGKGISTFTIEFSFDSDGLAKEAIGSSTGH
jgi:hypothetical protein